MKYIKYTVYCGFMYSEFEQIHDIYSNIATANLDRDLMVQ